MRLRVFKEGVEKFYIEVVNSLIRKRVPKESAYEAVQGMVEEQLSTKAYIKIESDNLDSAFVSYLKQAAKWKLRKNIRDAETEKGIFVTIENADKEQNAGDTRTREKPDLECPYCHDGVLNVHRVKHVIFAQACALCHTILGQGKQVRELVSMEEEDLFEWPNLDVKIDVEKAMAQLTPYERKVVNAVVHGEETLDGIANIEGVSSRTLYRVYAEAKRKLQDSLIEYSC